MFQRLQQYFAWQKLGFFQRAKAQLLGKWLIFTSIILFIGVEEETNFNWLNLTVLTLPFLFNIYWTWAYFKKEELPKRYILAGIYLDALALSIIVFSSENIGETLIYPGYLIISFIAFWFGLAQGLPFILAISFAPFRKYLQTNGHYIWELLPEVSWRAFTYLVFGALARYAGQGEELLEISRKESEELTHDLEKRLGQLSVLYEVNRSIRLFFDIEAAVKNALPLINSALKLDESVVCINAEASNQEEHFICFTARGRIDKQAPGSLQTLISKAKTLREPIIINKLEKELFWGINGESEAKALIASPIGNESELFGFIAGVSYQPEKFTVEDLQLLIAVANEMATCVQNFRLYQNLQSEKQFSVNLLESAGSIVVGMDTKGNITTFNQSASEITGYKKAEVIGKNWFEQFVPGASASDALQVIQALSEGNFPRQFENPLLTKDGKLRTISWNGTTIRNEKEQVIGILMIGQDITERKLMEEEIIKRNKQLAAFKEVTKVISEPLDLQEILHRSLQKTLNVIDADSGIIYLLDSYKKHLKIAAHEGVSTELVKNADYLELGEGFAGAVAERKEPILVEDIAKDPRLTRSMALREGIRSIADIPLASAEDLLGVLGVYRHRLRPFTEEEKDILVAIGRGIATAIQKVQMFKVEQTRLGQLEALYQSAKLILSKLELKDTIAALGDQARKALRAQYSLIALYNPQTDEMVAKAISGCGTVEEKQMEQIRFKRGEGTAGWVLKTGKSLLVEDIESDPRYVECKAGLGIKLKSLISIPIRVREQMIGVIEVANKIPVGAFDKEDLAFLAALADLAAIALENAQLYEEARQKVNKLSLLYEVGQTLSSVLDVERLLEIVALSVASLAGAESCTVMLLDSRTNELIVQAAKGPIFSGEIGEHFKVGEGVAGKAVEQKSPVLINDVSKEGIFIPKKKKEQGIKSLLSIPMIARGKAVGVINVANKIQGDFNGEDVRMLSAIASEVAITLENTELYQDMHELYVNTIQALAKAIDARDPNTRNHSENVTILAVAIAEEMKLSKEEIENIRCASLLHDIGKIGIPEAILQKPQSFSEEEYEYMKKHPQIGTIILEPIKPLSAVIPLILHHHESYDGSGYPQGLKGDEIPLGARIIRVADSFDAMISSRPNRDSISINEALDELERCAGNQFDPQVVKAFSSSRAWNKILETQKTIA